MTSCVLMVAIFEFVALLRSANGSEEEILKLLLIFSLVLNFIYYKLDWDSFINFSNTDFATGDNFIFSISFKL